MASAQEQEQAILSAYDIYAEPLFRHCYFRLYDRESAKDAVQDTFVRAWEYTAAGHHIDNMRAFLYRVANNVVIDRMRKRAPLSLDTLFEKGFDPRDESSAARIGDITAGKEVLCMLDRLEDPYRTVVVMRFIDDMMPREIATVLGETENAVSVRLHRAVKKARRLWNNGEINSTHYE